MKRSQWMAFAPLIVFGLLVFVLVVGLQRGGAPTGKFAQHVGERAPVTVLPLLNSLAPPFSPSGRMGHAYVVNFFASWCLDCRGEHEELTSLSSAHLPIVGIAYKDKADRIADYLSRHGNPYDVIALDEAGRAGIDWGLTGVPETFVVDAQGVIRWHHIGGLTADIVADQLMPLWENLQKQETK